MRPGPFRFHSHRGEPVNIKKTCIAVVAGLGVVCVLAVPAWSADADGNLMALTIHIKQTMTGMAAMPARTLTTKVCTRPGHFDPHALHDNPGKARCKVTNYRMQGNVITFDEVCTAPMAITSHGVFHVTGGADFTGTTHTAFNAAGHAVQVDTDYVGKKVGSCTYTPPGKPTH
jgi:Protein of unknown function (DUF3617)